MSLTAEDLTQIRAIFRKENKLIQDEIQALASDIKKIHIMVSKMLSDSTNVSDTSSPA